MAKAKLIRYAQIAAGVLVVVLAIGLYKAKTDAARTEAHVRQLQNDVDEREADLRALRAEIAHLESPARVETLAEQHLGSTTGSSSAALPESALDSKLPAPQQRAARRVPRRRRPGQGTRASTVCGGTSVGHCRVSGGFDCPFQCYPGILSYHACWSKTGLLLQRPHGPVGGNREHVGRRRRPVSECPDVRQSRVKLFHSTESIAAIQRVGLQHAAGRVSSAPNAPSCFEGVGSILQSGMPAGYPVCDRLDLVGVRKVVEVAFSWQGPGCPCLTRNRQCVSWVGCEVGLAF